MVRAVVEGGACVCGAWGVCVWGVGGCGGCYYTSRYPALILSTTVGPAGTIATFFRLTTVVGSSSSYRVLVPLRGGGLRQGCGPCASAGGGGSALVELLGSL